MSDDTTARLALPLLNTGQAQKEVTHNEALARLDLLIQPVVVAVGIDTPPDDPAPGEAWITGGMPTGAWAGHAAAIAGWTGGGWRFSAPSEGFRVWSIADNLTARWSGSAWVLGAETAGSVSIGGQQIIGGRQAAIADPTGGATIDAQARTVLAAILATLRTHGLIAG